LQAKAPRLPPLSCGQAKDTWKHAGKSAALYSFPPHGANGGCLLARHLGLNVVRGQQLRLLGFIGSLIADAETHEQLTKLEPCDEGIRSLLYCLSQLLYSILRLQVDAKRHAQQHPDFRHSGRQLNGFAKLGNQIRAFIFLKDTRVTKHALQLGRSLRAQHIGKSERSRSPRREKQGISARRCGIMQSLHIENSIVPGHSLEKRVQQGHGSCASLHKENALLKLYAAANCSAVCMKSGAGRSTNSG
jgi:hypothetical protein